MIEFKGKLSKNSKMRLLKDQVMLYFVIMLLVYFVVGGIALIIALSCEFMFLFWITMIVLTLLFVLFLVIPFTGREKELKYLVYKNIIVDTKDEYIYVTRNFDNYTYCVKFSQLKKIIENEEFFHLKIRFKINGVICQKDLITQGSIEEFKKIFDGLIV